MKKILLVLLFLFSKNLFAQVNQAWQPQPNPHRGMYINRLVYITPPDWNNGPPYSVDSASSILGTDANHDGVFEKEEALLGYCRDNHITLIVLLNLHKILGRGIMIWDENQGREVDAEEHLCRFMNRAREEYCIDQIAAATDNQNNLEDYTGFANMFLNPTPPISIPSIERNAPEFDSTLLVIEDTTLTIGSPEYLMAENLKNLYRISHFGNSTNPNERRRCTSYFNYFHMEYEFWQGGSDDYVTGQTIDPTCNDLCCNETFSQDPNCVNPCGANVYPSWQDAKFILHFLPTLRAMRAMADLHNNLNGFTPTDNEFMRCEAYTDNSPNMHIQMQDYALFLDGSLGAPTTNQSTCSRENLVVDYPRLLDRSCPYAFHRYPFLTGVRDVPYYDPNPSSGINYFQWLFENMNWFQTPQAVSQPNSDLHVLFSAEKISSYGYDSYWGPWFDERESNNIFEAEKIFYRAWFRRQYDTTIPLGLDRENAIHPGGVLWFTQSFMNGILDHPKIFQAEQPICTSNSTADVTFHYIGPTENGVQIELRIRDNANTNNVWPAVGWFTTSTFNQWVPTSQDFAAPDIIATGIPNLYSDYDHPYIVEMRLTYDGGCSYTYHEDLYINSGPAIQAQGPIEFCDGGNVTLRAPNATSWQWTRNGVNIPSSNTQEYVADESGDYQCILTGGSCAGTSVNTITVNVLSNPYVDIIVDCDPSSQYQLFAGPILNPSITTTGPGGVTYHWGTGSTFDRITATITGSYSLIVTSPNGCQRRVNRSYRPGTVPILTATNPVPASDGCASDGSQRITITNYSAGSVVHASISDGLNTYFVPWTVGASHDFTNLRAGHYTVCVTVGGGGCNGIISFDVGVAPTISLELNSPTVIAPLCHDGNDGSITITSISGGTAPFRIEVPSIQFDQSGSLPITISNLSAGIYFIRITDLNNCNWNVESIPITNPAAMNVALSGTDVTGCHDSHTGSVNATVTGGATPYDYLWNNSEITEDITGLGFGTYEVTVTDNSGCTQTSSVQIASPAEIELTPINPFSTQTGCLCDGELTYTYSGDFPPLIVTPNTWTTSGGEAQMTNLCAGNYSITVTDDHGCTVTESSVITGGAGPMNLNTGITDVSCNGVSDGTATVNVVSGGNAPFSYSWNTVPATLTQTVNGLGQGNYQVTVTDASGCAATASVTIDEPDAIIVTAVSTAILCNGGTSTVTITATGGTGSYTGTGSFPRTAGIWPFTVTDANNCSTTTSITISEPPPLAPVIATPVTNCMNAQLCAASGFSTYSWSPGGATSSCINASSPAVYTVSVTNASGCSGSSSYNFTGMNMSCCNSFTELTQSNFTSGSGSLVTIGPGSYSLNTSIVLSNDVTLTGCTIEIGAGVKIDVNGKHLIIQNGSLLYACNLMWRGIESLVQGGVVEVTTFSEIRDAQYGIKIDASTLHVTNATFTDNFVSIYFPGTVNGIVTTDITSSTFTSNQLRSLYSGQSPTPLTHSYAGILIEKNSLINIGNGATSNNYFTYLNAGIYSKQSNVIVQNSQFNFILPHDAYTMPFGNSIGTAVFAQSNGSESLTVIGNRVNDIINCKNGVKAWNTNVSVRNLLIFSCDLGIDVSYLNNCSAEIKNNLIDCNIFGVELWMNDFAKNVLVTSNEIIMGARPAIGGLDPHSIGIDINEMKTKNPYKFIRDNQISLHRYAEHGIFSNAIFGYTIDYNRIYFQDMEQNITGISLVKSESSKIECNSISGIDQAYNLDEQSALLVQESTSSSVNCNTFTNCYTGIKFLGVCLGGSGNSILSNDIGNHNIGLYYKGTGTRVDHQDFKGNYWHKDDYSIYGAKNENLSWALNDQYIVDQNGPRYLNGDNLTNHPFQPQPLNEVEPLVFIQDRNAKDNFCGDSKVRNGNCIIKSEGGDGGSDKRAAMNQEGSQDFDEETKWKTRVRLYEKLLVEPNYLDSDTVFVNFFQAMTGSYLEKIAELNKEKQDMYLNQQNLLQAIQLRSGLIENNMELIRESDSTIKNGGLTPTEIDSIKIHKQVLMQNIKQLMDLNQASINLIKAAIENKSDVLNAENALINSSKIYEDNEKRVNEAYFNVVYKDHFDVLNLYSTELRTIANQCPLSGGPAVYLARSLVRMIDPLARYEDELTCYQSGYSWRIGQGKLSSNIFLYPNPTSSEVTVRYSATSDARLYLFDEIGKLVFEKNLPIETNEYVFNVSDLQNGVYSCKFTIDNKTEVKPLVVLH